MAIMETPFHIISVIWFHIQCIQCFQFRPEAWLLFLLVILDKGHLWSSRVLGNTQHLALARLPRNTGRPTMNEIDVIYHKKPT